MNSAPIPNVTNADEARLDRLDAEIATLDTKRAAKIAERARLAERWGRGEGYLFRATPEHMRRHFAALRLKDEA